MNILEMPMFRHIGHIQSGLGDTFSVPENDKHAVNRQFNKRSRVRFVDENFTFYNVSSAAATTLGFSKLPLPFDSAWYWSTARKLLQYTRMYLTTEALAAYVIKTMGLDEPSASRNKRILVWAGGGGNWDNLQQSIAVGFDGLGYEVVIVMSSKHKKLYGCFSHNEKNELRSHAGKEKLRVQSVRQAQQRGIHTSNKATPDALPSLDASFSKGRFDDVSFSYEADARHVSSEELAKWRYENKRWAVYGGGNPWANRMRGLNIRFIHPDKKNVAISYLNAGLFDAVIYPYFHPSDPMPLMDFHLAIKQTRGKVGVMDNNDSIDDPRSESSLIDKHVYFFCRELRHAYC